MSGFFRLTSKKQKRLQKWFASFAIFSLFLQIFSGIFAYQPVWAIDLKSDITFDKSKNSFNISANTSSEVNYLLAYQTDKQTEAIQGKSENEAGSTFTKEIYAGTCSANGTCTPHNVLRGILKIEVRSETWLISKKFTIENGNLSLIEEGIASTLDLTSEENNWLANLNESTVAGATTEIAKVCLDSNQTIIDTTNEDWDINLQEGWAQTKEGVELGVKYLFPQENNVTVTFKCLPKDVVSPLKIQKVKVSDLKLPEGTNVYGEYAYDITTSMANGTFEYDITFPKPASQTAEVSYIEKTIDQVKQSVIASEIKSVDITDISQQSETVKAISLDHFTIFIVVWDFPNNPDNAIVDNGTAVNLTKTITAVNTNAPTFSLQGASTRSASATGWDSGSGEKYWQVDFDSTGYNALTLSSKQRSESKGPRDFKVQYKLGIDGSWTDITGATITVASNNFTSGVLNAISLPFACDNQSSVFLRWIMTSNVSADGHTVEAASTNRIDDIIIQGETPQPDLTVTKSHNPTGNANPGQLFDWVLTINNSGSANATFLDSQTILSDNLPNSNATYESPSSINGSGTTGNINCSISGIKDLSCTANGSVIIPVNGTIIVTIPVTAGSSTGTLSNPRITNGCKVDPTSTNGVISESNETNNACSDSVTINNNVNNPTLSAACGLDIALVLDNSTSIDATELGQMKTAMIAFTNALSTTPTQFSVTKFGTTADLIQEFTSDIGLVNTAINSLSVPGGTNYTNWQDALTKAKSTLPNRSNPNLVIFSSDGNPNRTGLSGTSVTESVAVADAVVVANAIKTSGTRILALGIGTDLNTANMQAISGPIIGTNLSADVITTNFATLATALATFASDTCGGTVTVTKTISGVSAPSTDLKNWEFSFNGNTYLTDESGKTAAIPLAHGDYNITETVKDGYSLATASCTGATVNGISSGNSINGIHVDSNKIVGCTFNNTRNTGTLTIHKQDQSGNPQSGVSIAISGTSSQSKLTDINGDAVFSNIPTGSYTVTETPPTNYHWISTSGACSDANPASVTVTTTGQSCTFINGENTGTLIVKKVVTNNNGGTKIFSDFSFSVNGGAAVAFEADGQNDLIKNPGNYSITEPTVTGYATTYSGCSGIILAAGETKTCTITNDDQQSYIVVNKTVKNDNGGSAAADDFKLTVDSNAVLDEVAYAVNPGAHTVGETNLSGYTKGTWGTDCDTDGKVTVALGETKTCTITNDDQQSYIVVNKTVKNDNGGSAAADDFKLTVDSNAVLDEVAYAVNPGAHTVGETNLSGYTKGTWGTDCDTDGKVTVALGETKTCTITNDDQQSYIVVNKTVKNDNGGSAAADDFKLTVDSNAVLDEVAYAVNPGAHTVGETNLSGYTKGTWGTDCDTDGKVTVALGETKTCTITNDDQQSYIVVNKTVKNDNGGSAAADDFKLTVDSNAVLDEVAYAVNPGAHTVGETNLSGYTKGTWGTDCDTDGKVTVALGETKTCTITNDDQQSYIVVNKTVKNDNGGSAAADDFKLTVDSNAVLDEVAYAVNPGAHTVGETNLSGYTKGTWGTDCDTDGKVTVALGETKTCTITNDDQQSYIVVNKTVKNDNGGSAAADDFKLTVDSNAVLDEVAYAVNPGAHTVGETNLSGYTKGTWGTDCDTDGKVTVALGETKTCTITNDDQQSYIVVNKTVKNDNGGSAAADDFKLTVDSNAVLDEVAYAVNPGAHTVGETNLSGYTKGTWGTDCDTDGKVTVALGETKTCTITNDDQQSYIVVNKTVKNDNGGSAAADDFKLTVDSNAVLDEVAYAVNPGAHTVGETNLSGYTKGTWGTDCDTDGKVTVALGETKTCTITNDDQQSYIVVNKTVKNDNGGSAAADDFKLTVDSNAVLDEVAYAVNPGAHTVGETNLSGYTKGTWGTDCDTDGKVTVALGETKTCTITNDDQQSYIVVNKTVKNDNGGSAAADDFKLTVDSNAVLDEVAYAVNPGAHTVGETNLSGYTKGTWGTDCDTDGKVTVALGETKTCTITNDDQQSYIVVNKTVKNDNGGSAAADDFKLTVDSNAVLDEVAYAVNPGAHTVGETNLSGYTKGTWGTDCDTDGKVTVALGETKTCTITNDDVAPKLTLVKAVVTDDGGDKVVSDFPLFIGANPATSGTAYSLLANTEYTVSETNQTGYSPSDWGGDCSKDGKITLLPGDDKTCTITNDDIQPRLTVTKVVDGGDKEVSDFPLFVDQTLITSGIQVGFDAGTYTVNEANQTGYTPTITGDCASDGTITLAVGDVKSCTITNTRDQGTITIFKNVDMNGDGDIDRGEGDIEGATDWTWDIANGGQDIATGQSKTLNTGTYTITEDLKTDYDLVGWSCTDESFGDKNSISINLTTDGMTCTFTNAYNPPVITLLLSKDSAEIAGKTANPGDTITYELTIINNSDFSAHEVVVKDSLPDGFSYVAGTTTGTGWTSSEPTTSGNKLTWKVGDINAGEKVIISYDAKISSSLADGSYANIAIASGSNRETEGEIAYSSFAEFYTAVGAGISYSTGVGGGSVLGAATEEGSVLGAATGSPTFILIMAILMILGGLLIYRKGKKLHV